MPDLALKYLGLKDSIETVESSGWEIPISNNFSVVTN